MTNFNKSKCIKAILVNLSLLMCLFFTSTQLLFSQKKLQLGVGTVLRSPNFNNINDNSLSKISLGFSVNVDYILQKRLKLKIAAESFNQTLKFPNLPNERLFGISIPLLLHQSILKNNKNWNLGIEAGCSWNIFEKIDQEYIDQLGLYIGRIQSQRLKSSFTNPNIIGRIGLNIFKDLKNNSTIHFNFAYNLSLLNWDNIYVESLSPINVNQGFFSQKIERNILHLSQNRLHFGFYITLGKITLSKEV